ncbi:TetR family transcriptional regulator [Planosporangium sp. 12N6]|uniref:TetR family transcriptional regulator n=1 Tax=Planosporangium spinosum TaxID=3402278 RepID=UPI003CEAB15D
MVTIPGSPGSPLCGRRERKKRETRAALEAAALRLFAERGYERTTVEDIADAADVAVRTFFRYFSSKRHVLFGDVAHTIVGRLRAALAERPADETPVEAVRAAMDAVDIDDGDQHRQILARMRLVQQLPELLPAYQMIFHELNETIAGFVAERTGEPAHALYPQLLAGIATLSAKATLCELENGEISPQALRALRHRAYDALAAGLERIDPS